MQTLLCVCGFFWVLGFPLGFVSAQTEDPTAVARRVHKQGGYTTELETRGELKSRKKSKAEKEIESFLEKLFSGRASSFRGLSTVITAIAVGFAFVLILLIVFKFRGAAMLPEDETELPSQLFSEVYTSERYSNEGSSFTAMDPHRLWEQGRHLEATQALVLKARRAVGWDPAGIHASETARETLARLGLEDPRYAALQTIVHEGEEACFSSRTINQEQFSMMQDAYEKLG